MADVWYRPKWQLVAHFPGDFPIIPNFLDCHFIGNVLSKQAFYTLSQFNTTQKLRIYFHAMKVHFVALNIVEAVRISLLSSSLHWSNKWSEKHHSTYIHSAAAMCFLNPILCMFRNKIQCSNMNVNFYKHCKFLRMTVISTQLGALKNSNDALVLSYTL